jgi:hypothetical protein
MNGNNTVIPVFLNSNIMFKISSDNSANKNAVSRNGDTDLSEDRFQQNLNKVLDNLSEEDIEQWQLEHKLGISADAGMGGPGSLFDDIKRVVRYNLTDSRKKRKVMNNGSLEMPNSVKKGLVRKARDMWKSSIDWPLYAYLSIGLSPSQLNDLVEVLFEKGVLNSEMNAFQQLEAVSGTPSTNTKDVMEILRSHIRINNIADSVLDAVMLSAL